MTRQTCPVCDGHKGTWDNPGAAPHNRGIKGEWVPCNHCEGTGEDWETEGDDE